MFKKKIVIPFSLLILLLYLLATHKPYEQSCSFQSMGGITTQIKAYQTSKIHMYLACSEIRDFFFKIEDEISIYRDDSFISRLNRGLLENPVKLPEHTYNIIKESLRISSLTNGYFDITVLPILEVWRKAEKQKKLPKNSEIQNTLNKVSWRKLNLNENKRELGFKIRGMKLDLGAIAKGYMVDEAQKILEKLGIRRGLIDCGGGIVVFDHSTDAKAFKIKLYNPDNESGINEEQFVHLTEGSVQTSGDYNRYYTIDQKMYSHIVNPHTGLPVGGCHSITVQARTGAIADGLGTGLCAMSAAGINPYSLLHGVLKDEVKILQFKQ